MSREKIRSALALVDKTKIPLSSFTISAKKYDTIADVYKRIMFFSANYSLNTSDDEKVKDDAFKLLNEIIENENVYTYEYDNAKMRNFVEEAAKQCFVGERFTSEYQKQQITVAKSDARKKWMKDRLLEMIKTLESVEQNAPDNFVDHALGEGNFENAIATYREKVKQIRAKYEKADEDDVKLECDSQSDTKEVSENMTEEKPKKKGFFRKLFGISV